MLEMKHTMNGVPGVLWNWPAPQEVDGLLLGLLGPARVWCWYDREVDWIFLATSNNDLFAMCMPSNVAPASSNSLDGRGGAVLSDEAICAVLFRG